MPRPKQKRNYCTDPSCPCGGRRVKCLLCGMHVNRRIESNGEKTANCPTVGCRNNKTFTWKPKRRPDRG